MRDERSTAPDETSCPEPTVVCGWSLTHMLVPTVFGQALRVLLGGSNASHGPARPVRVPVHNQGEQC